MKEQGKITNDKILILLIHSNPLILAKARQRFKGNWSSLGCRFVSQVKQPAWAEQHRLPDPPPKIPSARNQAKTLEAWADKINNTEHELKLRVGTWLILINVLSKVII